MTSASHVLADDLYERLGVPRDAAADRIRRAYHQLLRQYPPERAPEEFKRIREAYETLSSPSNRREYDSQPDPKVRQWVELGMAAMSAERYADAERYFKQILLQLPDLAFVRNHLGLSFLYQNKGAEAIAQYEKLVRKGDPGAHVFGNLAHAYRITGRLDDAVRAFTRAIELDDEDTVGYHIGLADVHMARDDAAQARRVLEAAIRADGRVDFEDLQFFTKLLEIELRARDLAGVQQVLDRIQAVVDDDEQGRYVAWKLGTLAQIMVKVEAFDYAVPLARAAGRLQPSDADYYALSVAGERLAAMDLDGAAALVRTHDAFAPDQWLSGLRPVIEKYCEEHRALANLRPIDSAPTLWTVNGCGFRLYGRRDQDERTNSYVATYYFVLLFIPLCPIACYRVIDRGDNRWSFLGRVPFSDRDRKHTWIFLGVLLLSMLWCSAGNQSSPASYSASSTSSPAGPAEEATPAKGVSAGPSALGLAGRDEGFGRVAGSRSGTSRNELRRGIEAEKTRLLSVEAELERHQMELTSSEAEIERLKLRLRRLQSDAEFGISVDQDEYDRLRRRHNRLNRFPVE